jgi:hypothetical protein
LKNQFPSSFFILCGCGCGWTTWALCISHICTVIFKNFNPLLHNSTRVSIVPILSTHVLMNLSTWCTICPQKTYHRLLLLLGAILKFHLFSPLRSNSHTNCKVNRLAFLTSHMTPYNTSPTPPFLFSSKI